MIINAWTFLWAGAFLAFWVFIGVYLALCFFYSPPPVTRRTNTAPLDRKPAMPTPPPAKTGSMPIPMPTLHAIDVTG